MAPNQSTPKPTDKDNTVNLSDSSSTPDEKPLLSTILAADELSDALFTEFCLYASTLQSVSKLTPREKIWLNDFVLNIGKARVKDQRKRIEPEYSSIPDMAPHQPISVIVSNLHSHIVE